MKDGHIDILIVEDETPIRHMYAHTLRSSGFSIAEAVNGQDGYRKAKELNPKLILLDLKMPVLSGDDMLRQLRSQAWASNIKVLVLTNISRSEAPMDLRFLGVESYLVKVEFTPKQIAEEVKKVFDLYKL